MKKNYLFVFAICLSVPAKSQPSLENIMGVPFPTGLASSQNKEEIAWVLNDQGVRNIWRAKAPDFRPLKVTSNSSDDGQDIGSLFFAGEDLIFTKGGAPNSNGEIPNPKRLQEGVERAIWKIGADRTLKRIAIGYYPKLSPDRKTIVYLSAGQIFSVPVDGSSEGTRLFTARGTQHSLRWSPDGSRLAFISNRGDHSFLGIYDFQSRQVKFPDPSVDHDDDPVWSPDGKKIAYVRTPNVKNRLPFAPEREGSPWSIRIFDFSSHSAKEFWKATAGRGSVLHDGVPAIDNKIFWTDDRITFPWEVDGWIHYYSASVNGGDPLLLTPGEGEVELASISSDRKHLIYSSNIGDIDRRHIFKVPLAGGKIVQLTQGSGIEWSSVETDAGTICLRSDATTPAWLWRISDRGEMTMIAPEIFPKTFPKSDLVTPAPVMITATDGIKIPAQLFLPKNHLPGQRHPAVIFFHGGSRRQMLLGFNYGLYYHHAYALNQFLASKGYIVLSVNYRSGIGYGLEFREALHYGAAGASEFNDVRAAGEFLKQREDVDGSKIGLWGGSYGGYLTALGLTRAPDLFSCGVDIHGVHDWNVVIKNFVPTYLPEKHQEFSRIALASSPISSVKSWRAPVLLIHGDDDRNVPFSESVSLVENLREQGVEFEQLVLPDEVHSFLLHESWLKAYLATAQFFEKQFGKKVSRQPSPEGKR